MTTKQDHGRKTSQGHVIYAGVQFYSYGTSLHGYKLWSSDDRCCVARNFNRVTYYATVDGVTIGRRYRTQDIALAAAFDKAYTGKGN